MKRFIATAATAALVMTPVAAQAHERSIRHGADRGWVGENHYAVKATDKECDSHTVWLLWQESMTMGTFAEKDRNGCRPGGTFSQARTGHTVTRIQLCEYVDERDRWNCTDWQRV